jgi:hypothetical protein
MKGIAFDVDQEAAIKARMRSLDMGATDRADRWHAYSVSGHRLR